CEGVRGLDTAVERALERPRSTGDSSKGVASAIGKPRHGSALDEADLVGLSQLRTRELEGYEKCERAAVCHTGQCEQLVDVVSLNECRRPLVGKDAARGHRPH